MGTIVWRNLSLVPSQQIADLRKAYDGDGNLLAQPAPCDEAIYVYMCRGTVIEVRPATGVRVTASRLEVIDHKRVVAAYPRERVMFASAQPVEPAPFS